MNLNVFICCCSFFFLYLKCVLCDLFRSNFPVGWVWFVLSDWTLSDHHSKMIHIPVQKENSLHYSFEYYWPDWAFLTWVALSLVSMIGSGLRLLCPLDVAPPCGLWNWAADKLCGGGDMSLTESLSLCDICLHNHYTVSLKKITFVYFLQTLHQRNVHNEATSQLNSIDSDLVIHLNIKNLKPPHTHVRCEATTKGV